MGKLIRSAKVEAVVDASPEAVWAIVSDPTRTGEWSHECVELEWLDGATVAVPGARFRGRNKQGRAAWSRINEVVDVDAPREIAWRTIKSPIYRDSTEWRVRVEPHGTGTRIVQTYEVLELNPLMERFIWLTTPAHRDRVPALTEDLHRLGAAAADSAARPLTGG